jgi:hypothetical protein
VLIIDVERIDLAAHHAGVSSVSIGGEALAEIRHNRWLTTSKDVPVFLPLNPASCTFTMRWGELLAAFKVHVLLDR